MELHVYTDGGLEPSMNTGGAASVFVFKEFSTVKRVYHFATSHSAVTSQQMELQAVCDTVLNIREIIETVAVDAEFSPKAVLASPVTIFSDSAYLVNCFEKEWWMNWVFKSNWKNYAGKPVENQDYWKTILSNSRIAHNTYIRSKGPLRGNARYGTINPDDERIMTSSRDSEIHIDFIKVKGHSGNRYNEVADVLAKEAARNGQTISRFGDI